MREPSSDPIRNLAAFIDAAKLSVALKGIDFDTWHWTFSPDDVVAKKMNRHRSYSNTLTFSNRETSTAKYARVPASGRAPMSEPYLSFSKADVRLYAENANVGLDVLRRRLCAHQFLERILRERYPSPEIGVITLADFELAEDALKTELGTKTAYKVSNQLQGISELIDSRRFTRGAIQYRTRLKRPNDGDELTEEGETEGIAKMISQEALDMLGDISSNPRDDRQRYLVRIVDLLVCGGFRIGEVLRLPVDCLVEGSGEPRVCPRRGIKLSSVGIRYAVEKEGIYDVKWLPHAVVPLAKRAVDDLRLLTQKARKVAQWMECNPGRLIHLSTHSKGELLPEGIMTDLLFEGARDTGISPKIERIKFNDERCLRVGDVEAYYLKKYDPSPVFSLKSGASQSLSETLVIQFVNQFHAGRKTLEFIPHSMDHGTFTDSVSPSPSRVAEIKSCLLDSDSALRAKSHQFRHWLSTLASNAGLSELDLAKWMGRSEVSQNEAYKHRKLSTRTEWARQAVLDGKLLGEVSRIADALPFEEKKAYLKTRIQAVHTTLYGCCIHNYASSPCTRHMQCLSDKGGKGCGDLLRTKGSESERNNLIELEAHTTEQIARFEAAVQSGEHGAKNWYDHAKSTLAGVKFALAIDNDPRLPAGAQVRVFDSPSKNIKS